MSKVTSRQFRRFVSTLAILGALLNAWVLTVHTTSVILAQLHTTGSAVVICHKGGATESQSPGIPDKKPAPNKSCPICSGLASLHLAVFSQPLLLTASTARGAEIIAARVAFALDRRPQRIFNRPPPLLT